MDNNNNNILMLPTAKTYLHHHPKKPGSNVLELVYDRGLKLTKKQAKILAKRVELQDKIMQALPPGKRYLFEKYMDLSIADTCMSIDQAILWTVTNEARIYEVMSL